MNVNPNDPKHMKHLMKLFPGKAPGLTHTLLNAVEPTAKGRIDYLLAVQQIKSQEVAEIIKEVPEVMEHALALTKAFEGLDADLNMEAALRASVLRYLSPLPYGEGDRMALMVRLLESALCLIDWTAVVERTGRASSPLSTPSTDSPPDPPGGTPSC